MIFNKKKKIQQSTKKMKSEQDDFYISSLMYALGLVLNENISIYDLISHTVQIKSADEYEKQLNKLCSYVFNGKRSVVWHDFRRFPYINHFPEQEFENVMSDEALSCKFKSDLYGTAKLYTSLDIAFIKFILFFNRYYQSTNLFLDIDYIINNTHIIEQEDVSINEVHIDELF